MDPSQRASTGAQLDKGFYGCDVSFETMPRGRADRGVWIGVTESDGVKIGSITSIVGARDGSVDSGVGRSCPAAWIPSRTAAMSLIGTYTVEPGVRPRTYELTGGATSSVSLDRS